MSVVPMKRISVAAMKSDRKAVLEYLQVLGAVHVTARGKEDELFTRNDMTEQKSLFLRNVELAESALKILKRNAPEKTGLLASLEGRKAILKTEYEDRLAKNDAALKLCTEVQDLEKKLADTVSGIPKLEDQKKALEPWMQFDLPLNLAETEKTAVFTGTLQGQVSLEQLSSEVKRMSGVETFDAEIISSDPAQTCIFLVCEKKDRDAVREALRRMSFALPPLSGMNPAERIRQIDEEIAQAGRKAEEIRGQFREIAKQRDDIRFVSDYYTMRADKYDVLSQVLQSRRVFFLEGYVPACDADALSQKLSERFDCAVEIREPGRKAKPPVLLKNNSFAEPLEGVTASFSLPGKGEIDPTFLSALFYYILFGIMLSDAAYGIILAVGCGIILLKYGKTMEDSMRKFIKMFFFCGISTTFWGFLFGSFFGDVVAVFGQTFLNKGPEFGLKPLWFEPLSQPMRMLTFCFILALLHMFTGLAGKAYMQIRAKKYLDAVYDVLFWYVLLIGSIVFLLTVPSMAKMLEVNPLSAAYQRPAAVCMAISAIGIILTGGRESKNWGKRLLKGLYSLYGITGWLSDVLSYSRLLALGLATGVIATVFNSMGSMGGNTVIGLIVFIVIFIIGNLLNIAINALGAYVHTNRLTFVEFFGKFYEGGGKPFRPFAANTKYYKIKEDK